MAYDEHLADRVRELIASLTAFDELKMFGGLTFMVNTDMNCGRPHGAGREGRAWCPLARGAQEMDFTMSVRGMPATTRSR
jgi:hypothetical protein